MAANSARPLLVAMLVAALSTGAASAAPASPSAEGWPHYGRDAGGTRYSPLTQIDASNLEQLEIIWQFRTGELGQDALQGEKLTFEATPVLWRGTLYFSTGFGTAFAIDAASGRQVWRFDSKVPRDLRFAEITSRGVTVWEDPERDSSAACKARVYLGNIVGRLYALDALTGEPCSDFGEQGVVDLHLDARPRLVGRIESPVEFNNVVVKRVGSEIVRLGHVATVEDGFAEPESYSMRNAYPNVGLSVVRSRESSTVKVAELVRDEVTEINETLPEGTRLEVTYDGGEDASNSLSNVIHALIFGAGLTIFVVYAFLNSWRSTLITSLSLPTSAIAAFIAIWLCGFTLNFMTLLGLSLAIGVLIDDAIFDFQS